MKYHLQPFRVAMGMSGQVLDLFACWKGFLVEIEIDMEDGFILPYVVSLEEEK
jgi:hypothetical protein